MFYNTCTDLNRPVQQTDNLISKIHTGRKKTHIGGKSMYLHCTNNTKVLYLLIILVIQLLHVPSKILYRMYTSNYHNIPSNAEFPKNPHPFTHWFGSLVSAILIAQFNIWFDVFYLFFFCLMFSVMLPFFSFFLNYYYWWGIRFGDVAPLSFPEWMIKKWFGRLFMWKYNPRKRAFSVQPWSPTLWSWWLLCLNQAVSMNWCSLTVSPGQ